MISNIVCDIICRRPLMDEVSPFFDTPRNLFFQMMMKSNVQLNNVYSFHKKKLAHLLKRTHKLKIVSEISHF